MALADNSLLQLTGRQQHLWNEFESLFPTEDDLISAALALGAAEVKPWSEQETAAARAVRQAKRLTKSALSTLRDLICNGFDPLGEAFCTLRSPEERRADGATYTPGPIVRAMVDWASAQKNPERIVDPGVGSGRFLMQAAGAFPAATLIGVDTDPLAGILARANLATMGHAQRTRIIVGDYRRFNEPASTPTLYIGNPPYVRHHQISARWKDWLFDEAARLGHKASRLAGLHVHFFLATARNARPGDIGAFITAAEWLDVNYGALVRALLLKELGGQSITVIEPTAQPFPDAATTAAITTFEIASKPTSIFFLRVDSMRDLDTLTKGRKVHRDRLSIEARWSYLTRAVDKPPEGYVELGELCRVHRGQVTGANDVWIAGEHSAGLPTSVLFRSVTRAREVFEADGVLDDASKLRCVIDLPVDLDELDAAERRTVDRFLKSAEGMGANRGYIAGHRKAWWSVGLRAPAPIISTYMARRPPAFALNKADARHINIAHGLYPRGPLSVQALMNLVRFMQTNISQRSGRTYAGGLTKFEPREMERVIVPGPAMLDAGAAQ
jgi:adenine-specific DNA-methyltransferase